MKRLKVAMVGGLSKTDPGLDGSWEIWNINGHQPWWVDGARWARSFHLHHRADLERDIPGHARGYEWFCYQHEQTKIYLLERWKKIPRAEMFPRSALSRMQRGNYHCGSFDWLVAFAVHLGAKEISLHGVGLNHEGGEPLSAGACLEYWCGYATGLGVRVTTDRDCGLFWNYRIVRDHKAYGYDSWDLVETMTK